MSRFDRLARRFTACLLDGRYALRAVRNDLRLFAFASLIIGFGVGACTAVFSVISPLMLRALPFDDADRLVWVANVGEGGTSAVTSRASTLRDLRAGNQSFDALSGYFAFFQHHNLVGGDQPQRLVGVGVAADFLHTLRVRPALGRNFVEEEGQWGGPPAVILTHALWQRQFAADPAVIGSAISLDGEPREVVGVLPASFDFAATFAPHMRIDVLTPFPISDETDAWGNTLAMVGRLAPGATVSSAQADLQRVLSGQRIDGSAPASSAGGGLAVRVSGLQEHIARPFRGVLLLLVAAAGTVMLIVCVNLSNLLLAKGARRDSEMAVRSALGAPRHRLVRQMLIESLVLSGTGALMGLTIALGVTHVVSSAKGLDFPMLAAVSVDGSTLVFSSMLAVLAGLAVGLGPAWRVSSGGEAKAFQGSRRGMSASRRLTRVRDGLVVAEIALACVLMVVGGLLLRSLHHVLDAELGFQPESVASWQLSTTRTFDSVAEEAAFFTQIAENVQTIPGVQSVGLTDAVPLGRRNRTWHLAAPGLTYDGQRALAALPLMIGSRYFETMQIPLIAGRGFTAADTLERSDVVILNETAARAVFHGEDPLGRKVMAGVRENEVIGIVADVRHQSLEAGSGVQMYMPITQVDSYPSLHLVVRSALPLDVLAGDVATAIRRVDPAMPTDDVRTLTSLIEHSVSPRRFTIQILATFAGAALLLAALGVYSVLSYVVTERMSEIGIRMALGESSSGVLRRLVGRTALLAAAGLAIGAAGSLAAARWIRSLLYDVAPFDPWTLAVVTVLLMLVSVLAGLIPALRASRIQATSVLRTS